MARHYHITTMGCQMNEYDSDYLGQLLMNLEYLPVKDPKRADLVLINTCTVRAKAAQKAVSFLGRMASLKKRRPDLILGLVGCLAQQEGHHLIKRFSYLDFVLGTREIGNLEKILEKLEKQRKAIVATDIDRGTPPPVNRAAYFEGKVKSYISIMEGCNNFCSYCVVPYVRGREISRSPDEIVKEAEYLIQQGVKEITLLGQNVNSYRFGKDESSRFPSLLRKLSNINGLKRIRFTTSHPKDLTDELIHCFDGLESLCPHIHLPVQAGSNRILELMNRGYTREKYILLIKKLREVRPDIAITSDVIVGFPGETEEDFQMTLDLVKKIEFDNLYSFKYSERKGTRAEKMGGKLGENKKSDRLATLQSLQKGITFQKNKALEGKELEILVEGHGKRKGQLTGRTITNKIVNFSSNISEVTYFVKVIIKHSYINSLLGERIID